MGTMTQRRASRLNMTATERDNTERNSVIVFPSLTDLIRRPIANIRKMVPQAIEVVAFE